MSRYALDCAGAADMEIGPRLRHSHLVRSSLIHIFQHLHPSDIVVDFIDLDIDTDFDHSEGALN